MGRTKAITISVVSALVSLAACTSNGASGTCTGETDSDLCQRVKLDCDLVTLSDICGRTRSVNCGACPAPQRCGAGGTPNVCGMAGSDAGTGTQAHDGQASDDAAADACTFVCPSASHWIEGTATLGGPNIPMETDSFVISFDEGAVTKTSPQAGILVTQIDIRNISISFSNPTGAVAMHWAGTGILRNYYDIKLIYSSSLSFVFELYDTTLKNNVQTEQNAIRVSCNNAKLDIGMDGYPILGSLSCSGSDAFAQFNDNNNQFTYANGSAVTLSYR